MASYFGAKDYQHLKDEFATSVLSGLLLTIVLSGISLAGSRLFIRLTQTPEEISAQASLYLQIISLGLIFTFFYNIFSAALRAIGDSRAPLYVLILTTIVNVFLEVFEHLFFVGREDSGRTWKWSGGIWNGEYHDCKGVSCENSRNAEGAANIFVLFTGTSG